MANCITKQHNISNNISKPVTNTGTNQTSTQTNQASFYSNKTVNHLPKRTSRQHLENIFCKDEKRTLTHYEPLVMNAGTGRGLQCNSCSHYYIHDVSHDHVNLAATPTTSVRITPIFLFEVVAVTPMHAPNGSHRVTDRHALLSSRKRARRRRGQLRLIRRGHDARPPFTTASPLSLRAYET